VNFFFSTNVSLLPGVKYYLQPVVQSGDLWDAITGVFNYPVGEQYVQGNSTTASDLWFREGVIVPEPAPVGLLLLGSAVFLLRKR
jgi:hypothetical protein